MNDEWRFESVREALAPRAWRDSRVRHADQPTLALAGAGKPFADGRWTRSVTVRPGAHYRFETRFRCQKVREPHRSILARVLWRSASGEALGQAEYPAVLRTTDSDGWQTMAQTYKSPADAASATLELVYRWDPDGSVRFTPAAFEPAPAPTPRPVRLAAVRYKPPWKSSPDANLARFVALAGEAAARKADIVCLPEAIAMAGTGRSYFEASEPIPGPSTRLLAECARKHRMWIVAGLLEREGPLVYNTAVLIDRDGALAGTYRKVCLPREEIDGGITPGEKFAAFDTDFGRIGLLICWDLTFPEAARQVALQGADIVLAPAAGYLNPLAPARAIENQVYLVTSSYTDPTAIYDPEGARIAEATDENRIAFAQIDLSVHRDWPWLGDLKNRLSREMPPARALPFTTG